MANLRWSSNTIRYVTAIWAAKIGFCFLGILSFGAAARAAVPAAAGSLASSIPGFLVSLRSWLAPPYLFVAVNFIILVIWKLSVQKQQHHLRQQWAAEERMADSGNPAKVKSFEPSNAPLLQKPSPEIWPDEISPSPTTVVVPAPDPDESLTSAVSCLTTESGERSTASSAIVAKKSAEPESKSSIAMAEEEDEVEVAAAAAAAAAGIQNDSLEATWKAIMEKSSRAAAKPPAATAGRDARQPKGAPSSAGHDELNRRFEDFIKKNREQIGLSQ